MIAATGCAPTQHQLSDRANHIAQPVGLVSQVVTTSQFQVMTYARINDSAQPLWVYLEGDGKAWITRTRISLNPTPHDPVALRLAAQDHGPNVLYIARPCQYVPLATESRCTPHFWSQARYSPQIVEAIDEVISAYIRQTGAEAGIELVGYSGGGALAVLVAIKREDVRSLRTIAGNLDTDTFTRLHQVSPLKDSLNPADYAGALQNLPQRHYVGSADKAVPEAIARSYWEASDRSGCVEVRQLSGVTHSEGWQETWPSLLNEALPCPPKRQSLVTTTAQPYF